MDKLKKIYNEMYQAMIAKDTEALEQMLDEDFVLIHMTGMRQSKLEFMGVITNGNAAVFGGGRKTWPLQLDIDLLKKAMNGK